MRNHRHFANALTAWHELGGALNYVQPLPGDSLGLWQVWSCLSDLEDAVNCTPREATVEALRQGGMSDEQIETEMADWHDDDAIPRTQPQ